MGDESFEALGSSPEAARQPRKMMASMARRNRGPSSSSAESASPYSSPTNDGTRSSEAHMRVAPGASPPKNQDLAPTSALDRIISLQRFQGYWDFDQALLDVCGIRGSSTARSMLNDNSTETPSRKLVWGTILAIIYLERKAADDKDAWELVADKARNFLQDSGVIMQDEMAKAPLKDLLAHI